MGIGRISDKRLDTQVGSSRRKGSVNGRSFGSRALMASMIRSSTSAHAPNFTNASVPSSGTSSPMVSATPTSKLLCSTRCDNSRNRVVPRAWMSSMPNVSTSHCAISARQPMLSGTDGSPGEAISLPLFKMYTAEGLASRQEALARHVEIAGFEDFQGEMAAGKQHGVQREQRQVGDKGIGGHRALLLKRPPDGDQVCEGET